MRSTTLDQTTRSAPVCGVTVPQPGVGLPEHPLRLRRAGMGRSLWVVGAHGGSGESTIAGLDDGWAASGHFWPQTLLGTPLRCVLVARTSAFGLESAQSALQQWAAGAAGHVDLLGLVLIADAPGKLPRPLRDLAAVVSGGAPRVWRLPWLELWRCGEPASETACAAVRSLVGDLRALTSTPTTTPMSCHSSSR